MTTEAVDLQNLTGVSPSDNQPAIVNPNVDLPNVSLNDPSQIEAQQKRRQCIQMCIQSFVHACRCLESQCAQPSCMKMKRVVAHTKVCKLKAKDGCPICKHFAALCCYHAKCCNDAKCLVPFCPNIKLKLKQQELASRANQRM